MKTVGYSGVSLYPVFDIAELDCVIFMYTAINFVNFRRFIAFVGDLLVSILCRTVSYVNSLVTCITSVMKRRVILLYGTLYL